MLPNASCTLPSIWERQSHTPPSVFSPEILTNHCPPIYQVDSWTTIESIINRLSNQSFADDQINSHTSSSNDTVINVSLWLQSAREVFRVSRTSGTAVSVFTILETILARGPHVDFAIRLRRRQDTVNGKSETNT